jgi:hypothetical protein
MAGMNAPAMGPWPHNMLVFTGVGPRLVIIWHVLDRSRARKYRINLRSASACESPIRSYAFSPTGGSFQVFVCTAFPTLISLIQR